MNITVYCGSNMGNDPRFAEAARELGTWIGANAHTLVYGGGGIGLMGEVSRTTVEAGGRVIGTIPEFLLGLEAPKELHIDLTIVDDMPQRKTRMIEMGDAFVALPGGQGTLEEISEVISLVKLDRTQAPVMLLDLDGYYQPLLAQLRMMVRYGFCNQESVDAIAFPKTVDELTESLVQAMK